MRLRLAGFTVISLAVTTFLCTFSACGNSEPFPDAGNVNNASSTSSGGSSSGTPAEGGGPVDAGGDANDGGDAAVPDSCKNTHKDNLETDVDCGGTQCAKCIDGKKCIAPSDCAGGSCVTNLCVTASCKDNITNGLETDKDCGGGTCAKCQYGKACFKNEDCLSNTCAGANGGTAGVCKCPTHMTEVSTAAGGVYCIDATEVTKSDYNRFWTSGWPVSDQPAECMANATFTPRDAWGPATSPPVLAGTQGLQFNISLPVHYVDWCDAFTYCKWANKELCGRINGGAIDIGAKDDAATDAWYNACSQQGTKNYPYGTSFDDLKCNGAGMPDGGVCGPSPTQSTYGCAGSNQDTNVFAVIKATDINGTFTEYENAQCVGGSFGLFQMSGNVAEWENSCDGTVGTSKCNLRGGSYAANNDSSLLRCDSTRTEDRLPSDSTKLKDVGFRCCLY